MADTNEKDNKNKAVNTAAPASEPKPVVAATPVAPAVPAAAPPASAQNIAAQAAKAAVPPTPAAPPTPAGPTVSNLEDGIISDKVQVVLVAPFNDTVGKLATHFRNDARNVVHESGGGNTAALAKQLLPCLVISSINQNTDVVKLLNFLKAVKDEVKANRIKFIVLSRINNPAIIRTFESLGCHEYIIEPVSERSLTFKMNLQVKALSALRNQLRQAELRRRDGGKVKTKDDGKNKVQEVEEDPNASKNLKEEEANEVEGEVWVFKGKQPKKQGGKWSMRMKGPDPTKGDWMPAGENPDGSPKWRFVEKGEDPKAPPKKGGWEFNGDKPGFANGEWNFQSEEPELSLVDENGEKKATKVKTDGAEGLVLTKDSETALKALEKQEQQEAKDRDDKKKGIFAGNPDAKPKDPNAKETQGEQGSAEKVDEDEDEEDIFGSSAIKSKKKKKELGALTEESASKKSEKKSAASTEDDQAETAQNDKKTEKSDVEEKSEAGEVLSKKKKPRTVGDLEESKDSKEAKESKTKDAKSNAIDAKSTDKPDAVKEAKESEKDKLTKKKTKSGETLDEEETKNETKKDPEKKKRKLGDLADMAMDFEDETEDYKDSTSADDKKGAGSKKKDEKTGSDKNEDKENDLNAKGVEAKKKKRGMGVKDDESAEKDGDSEGSSAGAAKKAKDKKEESEKKAAAESKEKKSKSREGKDAAGKKAGSSDSLFADVESPEGEFDDSGLDKKDEPAGGWSKHRSEDEKKKGWKGHDSEDEASKDEGDKHVEVDAVNGSLKVKKPGEEEGFEYLADHFGSANGAWEAVGNDPDDSENRKTYVFIDAELFKTSATNVREINPWWIFRGDNPKFIESKKVWSFKKTRPEKVATFNDLTKIVQDYLLQKFPLDGAKEKTGAPTSLRPSSPMLAVYLSEVLINNEGDVPGALQKFSGFISKNMSGVAISILILRNNTTHVLASSHEHLKIGVEINPSERPALKSALELATVVPSEADGAVYCPVQIKVATGAPKVIGFLLVEPLQTGVSFTESGRYLHGIAQCLRGSLLQLGKEAA